VRNASGRCHAAALLRKCCIALNLVISASAVPALSLSVVPAQAEDAQTALEPLSIVTASGTHDFSVEVMRTDAERERGLMFRRYLPNDRGMLFNFDVEQPVMMWMKNTFLPLDMIFMDRTGKVVSIAANTEPLSEHIIPSVEPAYAVLEVNAGTAARIGLKVGDRVHNEIFNK
jgi:uncharacterized protein